MTTTTWRGRDPDTNDLVTFRFCSLADYVRDGGVFCDAGNNGECAQDLAADGDFVAACVVDGYATGLPANDALELIAGLPGGAYWSDSAHGAGYLLLREWPANVSLEVRFVQADDPFAFPRCGCEPHDECCQWTPTEEEGAAETADLEGIELDDPATWCPGAPDWNRDYAATGRAPYDWLTPIEQAERDERDAD